jgi:hypothetical protein
MGDSGEGLVDAEGRIQERMEELERERRQKKHGPPAENTEQHRAIESLRLARTQIERQMAATNHPARKAQLTQAMDAIDRQMLELKNGSKR